MSGAPSDVGRRTRRRTRQRARRRGAGLAAAAVALMIPLAAPLVGPPGVGAPAQAAGTISTPGGTTEPVSVTLVQLTPRVPDAEANTPLQKVTIIATVTNNSAVDYSDFDVGLERGDPLTRQDQLDNAIATAPTTTDLVSSNNEDQRRPLPAHSSTTVTYTTDRGSDKMCLCLTSVYPYALVVHATTAASAAAGTGPIEVGRTQILVPALLEKTQPVKVGWLWPLIDRPHRSLSDSVFNDDGLAASTAPGGRLYRALQVADSLSGRIRLTLVVDPELLDSLAIMAGKGGYSYRSGSKVLPGQGAASAAAWLSRFQAVAAQHDVVLTAYADPDINAVTRAGLTYSRALDPQVQQRIAPYLPASALTSDLVWPAGGTLTSKALDAAIGAGASMLVLSDAALSGQNKSDPKPDAISPLPSAGGNATALVTDTPIQRTISQIFRNGSLPADAQQTLLSQLAIRTVVAPTTSHFVLLAPDRYVDADPTVAEDTIMATISQQFTRPIGVPAAMLSTQPVDRGPLQTSAESEATEVGAGQMNDLVRVTREVASLREAVTSNASAQLLGGFAAGVQRGESSAWRGDRGGGLALTSDLTSAISDRLNAVSLINPAEGTYGLSSSHSPVIVTVQNKLAEDVTVLVNVRAAPGVIGFTAPPQLETIPANSRKTIQIPTRTERLGQFRVTASLSTPDGQQLGSPVDLRLRSTALGGITKTITIVAGAVLVLALIRRLVLRLRRGHAGHVAGATA